MWKEKITDITSQKQIVMARIEELITSIDEQAIQIDQAITQYHELLLYLQLIPSSTQLANGVDYRLVLEQVDDVTSVSTRNVQHYQTQILSNSMLVRLEVRIEILCYLQSVLDEYSKSVDKAITSFREEIVKFDVWNRRVSS